ncbi:alpha-glucosidase 2-like [Battus philenor]|uniref:alpha-glucosidase 2-like n=1 Tax=Battus philenor TaxID=42288 RepID=UPI0035CEE065
MDEKYTTKFLGGIEEIIKRNVDYLISYKTGEKAKLYVVNSHVFRYFMSPNGEFLDYPIPNNPNDIAKITTKDVEEYDKKMFKESNLKVFEDYYLIDIHKVQVKFNKIKGTISILDKRTNKEVLKESYPLSYNECESIQTLHQHTDEYFFGGGMQNGRFTHKGSAIHIINSNNWVNGGVTSPCPFYWSSYGYGVLRNTWKPGVYDFGSHSSDTVITTHRTDHFDAFFVINSQPQDILCDYYEITGQPIFMPEYAFYEAHLNAFNRDYWVKVTADTSGAILFEDGNYYKSYKPNEIEDKKGILESLNGEKENYQFSARAMIDRYRRHDMPLGWFIPNDGYGAGYGQTDSLDGDIENLRQFVEYAKQKGVEVALWTESKLHPADPTHPKKGERDLSKELSVAKVVALKCDVAWIGDGYSFGLNAIDDVTKIFMSETNVRPLIIMVDGWAGTQRYSGIWSGDQTGGQWEYIRFHIPTYIGTGLSGQPIVGSDMDGIYGGKVKEVNIRDYQWKTFTPLQLNMDGWGYIQKTPFSFDDEATSINRAYLKLKSMFLPYNYTISHDSIEGLPMIRAMFLEFPKETVAYTKDCQYQFMWGPYVLVAPIYENGFKRDGVYLPDKKQIWIDYFTGEKLRGGNVVNNLDMPLWKIPIFIKDGAIIPMTKPNNNPNEIDRTERIFTLYPNKVSKFNVYEDDGITSNYLKGQFAKTEIVVRGPLSNNQGDLHIRIEKTKGTYDGMIKGKTTLLQIMASQDVSYVKAAVNGEPLQILKANSYDEFETSQNVFFFKQNFSVNPYLEKFNSILQSVILIKIGELDVTSNQIQLKISDYVNNSKVFGAKEDIHKDLNVPNDFRVDEDNTTATTITLHWSSVNKAVFYEIERDGVVFTNLIGTKYTFNGFDYNSIHKFKIRAGNDDGVSEWSDIVEGKTKENPYKNVIQGVKVMCNIPCQPSQEVCNLTDGDLTSMWHSHWYKPVHKCDIKEDLKLVFDLGKVYDVEKMEYTPRDDAGNGTFTRIQYRISVNKESWSPPSKIFTLECDSSVKTIHIGVKLRYIEVKVLQSVGGYGSGKHIRFYKK